MIVNSLTSIGAAIIIAFYFSWKLTLVVTCFLPLIGLSGAFQAKMLTGFANEDKKAMEAAGQVSQSALIVVYDLTIFSLPSIYSNHPLLYSLSVSLYKIISV